ncbi:MAG: hypothetical protein Q8937_01065 [Bacteroidota bacterium]|nr:hypothetical protein [Bacteroidota bacterium]
MNRITACCIIAGRAVSKNDKTLFKNDVASDPVDFLVSAYTHFGFTYPRFYKMDPLSKLGWLTSEILLTEPPPGIRSLHPEQVGLMLTNANSSLDTDLKYYASVKDIPSPSLFGYTLPNIMIGEICIRNNFKGENTFFITDGFDAGLIRQQVDLLIDGNILKACICGWVDLLREDYKAVLFLVEGGGGDKIANFTEAAMIDIFSQCNDVQHE